MRTKLLMWATLRSVLQPVAGVGQGPPSSTPASAKNQL
jgi:hypothetical protein